MLFIFSFNFCFIGSVNFDFRTKPLLYVFVFDGFDCFDDFLDFFVFDFFNFFNFLDFLDFLDFVFRDDDDDEEEDDDDDIAAIILDRSVGIIDLDDEERFLGPDEFLFRYFFPLLHAVT